MAGIEIVKSEPISGARIKVIGVGGGGNNAVDRMIEAGVDKTEFVAINTDIQQLESVKAPVVLQIGGKLTSGLGAGAKPEIGRQAAEESKDEIKNLMKDTEMVFITAGMGGGTGTGAAPVIAEAAKSAGVLTVAVVTKPFCFEGPQRMKNAEAGIKLLSENVDSIVTIPNDMLLKMADKKVNLMNSFEMADEVLRNGVQGIIEVITQKGLINCDFADVQTIMKDSGIAHMGIGMGSGENAAIDAAEAAINSPILETSIDNAKGVLLNITGGSDFSLVDVNEVSSLVGSRASNDATIIMGISTDESLKDQVKVTIIATGLEKIKKSDDSVPSMMDKIAPKFSEPQEPVFTERRTSSASSVSSYNVQTVPEETDKAFVRTARPSTSTSSSSSTAGQTADDVSVPRFNFFRKS